MFAIGHSFIAQVTGGVFPHLVEHDHGVVEGERQHGQQADHGGRGDFEAGNGVQAGNGDEVHEQGQDGGDSHFALQSDGDVGECSDEEHAHGHEHAVGDGAAPGFAHGGVTDGIGGLLACAIDRLIGVEKRLPGRINLALSEPFGVDFQDSGVPAAHDLHLFGVYPGGLCEGLFHLGGFQVCGRHIHFCAALKVDTQVEAAESDAK